MKNSKYSSVLFETILTKSVICFIFAFRGSLSHPGCGLDYVMPISNNVIVVLSRFCPSFLKLLLILTANECQTQNATPIVANFC